MDKVRTQNDRIFPFLMASFLFFIGIFLTQLTYASTSGSELAGKQLAYYHGSHGGYEGVRHGSTIQGRNRSGYRGAYHQGGCRRYCLVNRSNGHVIRCKKRCN